MLKVSINFKCVLCDKFPDWYIHPMDETTKSGDSVKSLSRYKVTCKNCKTSYLLEFNINLFDEKNKKAD